LNSIEGAFVVIALFSNPTQKHVLEHSLGWGADWNQSLNVTLKRIRLSVRRRSGVNIAIAAAFTGSCPPGPVIPPGPLNSG
jgi:hypothetical protein